VFNLGMGEITVILLLALIFLGPAKLPDLAAGLGKIIKEIRKATSDVKNEIALDDTFRKPFEDLRDAVTLHPDELKRRDQATKFREEMAARAAEEAASGAALAPETNEAPDGLSSPVQMLGVTQPGPNDTIVQAGPPRGATLDDIPTPPPVETGAAPLPPKPPGLPAGRPPAGTVARPDTLKGVKPMPPVPPAARPTPTKMPAVPTNGEGAANITQILKEEDLIPTLASGRPGPPPPPHLPGLRPAGAPRPGVAPPLPPNPLDKKKS
jgi:sec-independent protein translocase protein TatB